MALIVAMTHMIPDRAESLPGKLHETCLKEAQRQAIFRSFCIAQRAPHNTSFGQGSLSMLMAKRVTLGLEFTDDTTDVDWRGCRDICIC